MLYNTEETASSLYGVRQLQSARGTSVFDLIIMAVFIAVVLVHSGLNAVLGRTLRHTDVATLRRAYWRLLIVGVIILAAGYVLSPDRTENVFLHATMTVVAGAALACLFGAIVADWLADWKSRR